MTACKGCYGGFKVALLFISPFVPPAGLHHFNSAHIFQFICNINSFNLHLFSQALEDNASILPFPSCHYYYPQIISNKHKKACTSTRFQPFFFGAQAVSERINGRY